MNVKRYQLSIGGQVQAVGYRPFVYRLARRLALRGWVRNEGARVSILVEGEQGTLDRFCRDLIQHAPAIARPRLLEQHERDRNQGELNDFAIKASQDPQGTDIHLPPDYFTCAACLGELRDTKNRRYHYPFINCTQCGPRYTLITALPYDRPHTTMSGFEMCAACREEYTDPANRRFHAEPIACAQCGPRLLFEDATQTIESTPAALQACVEALHRGRIISIKGIGGYHLCCDATNEEAVTELRRRKARPHKPLALMYPLNENDGLERLRRDVLMDDARATELLQPARPIVLLAKGENPSFCEAIAPGLNEVGVMLAYSPLHYLVLDRFGGPIVATSANISGEPVLTEATEVRRRLATITDTHLHHNRPIARPADDSVLRPIADRLRPLRIGRGLSPLELSLPFQLEMPVLACGGHMKNTVALAWQDRAVISPHIGDLDAPRSQAVFQQVIDDLKRLYRVEPEYLICDAHPGYASTRWASSQRQPALKIFHHHAHAAMLAGEYPEHRCWLVFTWDGVGYGEDGTLWGGEALLGVPGDWRRLAHWRPFQLPGGEKAGRQPWRSAAALCWATQTPLPELEDDTALLHEAWQKGINAPATTAVGRLFDAAAALLGLCADASFEGQGPMLLEACAETGQADALELPLNRSPGGPLIHDWSPLLPMLLNAQMRCADRARCFHASVARALVQQAQAIRERHGEFAVGLSGGVFQNRLLTELAVAQLEKAGFTVCLPQRVPLNDGGLCFGQLIEAAARLAHKHATTGST